jgi:ribose transport system ATP-binding protein
MNLESVTGTIVIEARNVDKHFDGTQALKGVTLALRAGEIHCLVGENGAGKSTLAKVFAGEVRPDGGQIIQNGVEVTFSGPIAALQAGVVLVHQELNLVGAMTVAENVAMGREPSHYGFVDKARLRQMSNSYTQEVGLHVNPDTPVERLNIADQQLVEIAHALATESRVLLLDEPTSSLARHDAAALLKLLRGIAHSGRAVLLISHQLDEVLSCADRITVFRDGALVASMPGHGATERDLIKLMTGRDFSSMYRLVTHVDPTKKPVFEVEHLQAPGVKDASFVVRPGEIVGIGGLVGSGRTELLMALYGATRITGGHATLEGTPYAPMSPSDALSHGVGLVPENRKEEGLVLDLAIRDNICLAVLPRLNRGPLVSVRAESQLVKNWISRLRIKLSSSMKAASSLSGGNQQKVVLSKVLSTKPKVLLLDEPTRGIDVGAKAEVHELMSELAAEGIAIVFVTSVLPELLMGSDRIVVMRGGRTVADLDGKTVDEETVMQYAFQG